MGKVRGGKLFWGVVHLAEVGHEYGASVGSYVTSQTVRMWSMVLTNIK